MPRTFCDSVLVSRAMAKLNPNLDSKSNSVSSLDFCVPLVRCHDTLWDHLRRHQGHLPENDGLGIWLFRAGTQKEGYLRRCRVEAGCRLPVGRDGVANNRNFNIEKPAQNVPLTGWRFIHSTWPACWGRTWSIDYGVVIFIHHWIGFRKVNCSPRLPTTAPTPPKVMLVMVNVITRVHRLGTFYCFVNLVQRSIKHNL